MRVAEFDVLSRGTVYYTIYQGMEIVDFFTRDIFQDEDKYRENLVKVDRYENALIFDIYSMNDIIHVRAITAKTDR